MTYFCIFLQFLIFCTTPTEERPVRLLLWHSSKVREGVGGFQNQPRNFKGQQSNKARSRHGRHYHLNKRKGKCRDKRRNTRQVFCSKRHGRTFLLKKREKKKLTNTYCGKQVRKKRQIYKREDKNLKQNESIKRITTNPHFPRTIVERLSKKDSSFTVTNCIL